MNQQELINAGIIDILLTNDGSTTRLIECLVGGKVQVEVRLQEILSDVEQVPSEIADYFAGPLLHRITSLVYEGQVVSENVVYADVSNLPDSLQLDLDKGELPLGKLMKTIEYRRESLWTGLKTANELNRLYHPITLLEGKHPFKQYLMVRNNQIWFHISEVFYYQRMMEHFLSTKRESVNL